MTFLHCTPPGMVRHEHEQETFFADPPAWLGNTSNRAATHEFIVTGSATLPRIADWLGAHTYQPCARYFHSHFPDQHIGGEIVLLAKPAASAACSFD